MNFFLSLVACTRWTENREIYNHKYNRQRLYLFENGRDEIYLVLIKDYKEKKRHGELHINLSVDFQELADILKVS